MPNRFLQRFVREADPLPPLPMTAARVVRGSATVSPYGSFGVVVRRLQQEGVGALPVVEGGFLVGWITDASVAAAMASDDPDALRARDLLAPPPPMISPLMPLADLLVLMREEDLAAVPLGHPNGLLVGIATRADVLAEHTGHTPAPRMGGMATPLGVYLTTGKVSGGAGSLGLVLTGALMAALHWVVVATLSLLLAGLARVTGHPFVVLLYKSVAPSLFLVENASPLTLLIFQGITLMLTLGAFLLALRLAPWLVGYHAAEHQTVNALEAGEPLTVEAVSRMPRVHPRCGTNLVAMFLLAYLGVYAMVAVLLMPKAGGIESAVLVALGFTVFTAVYWRRIGAFIQQHLTTRPATAQEIASGIAAAEDVLRKHRTTAPGPPTLPQRLMAMGIFQVLTGAIVVGLLLQLADFLLDGFWRFLVQ